MNVLFALSMIYFFIHMGVALHVICMAGLMLFGCHRLWLIACWGKSPDPAPAHPVPACVAPRVTIQIPIYNESRVAGRIINAAAGVQWPLNRLDIQILDDSSDETTGIADERTAFWMGKGVPVRVIRRSSRQGYKAGALANGLRYARGEFIALFDADFIPPPDFLARTIPHFSDPGVGMVQTRWGFLNAGYSWLTRIQALLLAPHFSIEHKVRSNRSLFFNFNGTAGVWRKTAIESAGGWQSDTITEDLDLSYRAQLAGWRFVYLDSVIVPSELPVTLSDFRGQQQRWSKGSIQTARKILPLIIKSHLSIPIKIEAAVHLMANLCWVFGFVATITLYPLILFRSEIGPYHILRVDVPVFIFSGGSFLFYYLFYTVSARQIKEMLMVPVLPALSIGLAPSLFLSVVKGFFSFGGYFNRTLKFGIIGNQNPGIDFFKKPDCFAPELLMNTILLLYTSAPISLAWHRGTWMAMPFLVLFPLGFFLVICWEISGSNGRQTP
jgi:cellulose synthase/poly-beta-1,6-N-acetylglucosamine synthase-like glycosyltransferase